MTREQLKERLDKRFDVRFRGNSKIEFVTLSNSIAVTYRLYAVSELDTLITENAIWNVTDCQLRMMEVKIGCEDNILYIAFSVAKDFFDEEYDFVCNYDQIIGEEE